MGRSFSTSPSSRHACRSSARTPSATRSAGRTAAHRINYKRYVSEAHVARPMQGTTVGAIGRPEVSGRNDASTGTERSVNTDMNITTYRRHVFITTSASAHFYMMHLVFRAVHGPFAYDVSGQSFTGKHVDHVITAEKREYPQSKKRVFLPLCLNVRPVDAALSRMAVTYATGQLLLL